MCCRVPADNSYYFTKDDYYALPMEVRIDILSRFEAFLRGMPVGFFSKSPDLV
jgi:hypothetical protein